MKKSVIYILLALLVSACGDDLMTGGRQYYYPESGVFVCNEGNFMYGNAALTYYDPSSKEVENQIFYNANTHIFLENRRNIFWIIGEFLTDIL